MTPEELATRRVEWLAERRILTADKQRIERRLAELDEILTVFAK